MPRCLLLVAVAIAFSGCDSASDASTFATADASSETVSASRSANSRAAVVTCGADEQATTVVRDSSGVVAAYTGTTSGGNCVSNSQNTNVQFTVLLPEALTPTETERLTAPEDFPFCTTVGRDGATITTTDAFVINRANGQSKVVCHFR